MCGDLVTQYVVTVAREPLLLASELDHCASGLKKGDSWFLSETITTYPSHHSKCTLFGKKASLWGDPQVFKQHSLFKNLQAWLPKCDWLSSFTKTFGMVQTSQNQTNTFWETGMRSLFSSLSLSPSLSLSLSLSLSRSLSSFVLR